MKNAAMFIAIVLAFTAFTEAKAERATEVTSLRSTRCFPQEKPKSPEEQAKDAKIQTLKDKAKAESGKGDWQKCTEYLEQALECKPDPRVSADLAEDLIKAYDCLGRWDRSEIYHRHLAKMGQDPSTAGVLAWTVSNAHQQLYLAAYCALKRGNYEQGISTLRSLIADKQKSKTEPVSSTEPAYSECFFLLANAILDSSSKYQEALSLYDKCIKDEEKLNKNVALPFRSHNLYRSPELIVNLFICYSGTNQQEKANELRKQLKAELRAYLSSTTRASRSAGEEALSILSKESLTRADEVRLMETIPLVNFTGAAKIGTSDHLLQRALVIRQNAKETQKVAEDYAGLVKLYMSHFESKAAQPFCWQRMQELKKMNAPLSDQERAKADWTKVSKS